MYWWNMVNLGEDNMLFKVYTAQKNKPVRGDWVKLLDEDKQEFNLKSVSDNDLKKTYKSKTTFKNYLKKKAIEITVKYINSKKEKHSKLDNLKFTKLKCSPYLNDPRISQREAKLLFKLRTRMYHVKANYKNKYPNNLTCELCKSTTYDQPHLMECSKLKQEVPEIEQNTTVKYSHLFSNDDKMIPAIKLFSLITRKREELIEELNQETNK